MHGSASASTGSSNGSLNRNQAGYSAGGLAADIQSEWQVSVILMRGIISCAQMNFVATISICLIMRFFW